MTLGIWSHFLFFIFWSKNRHPNESAQKYSEDTYKEQTAQKKQQVNKHKPSIHQYGIENVVAP